MNQLKRLEEIADLTVSLQASTQCFNCEEWFELEVSPEDIPADIAQAYYDTGCRILSKHHPLCLHYNMEEDVFICPKCVPDFEFDESQWCSEEPTTPIQEE